MAIMLVNRMVHEPPAVAARLDLESAEWLRTELTARQRAVFVAIVLNEVPLDARVIELGSNRNAIYKMLFDARRKLRAPLAANGYLGHDNMGRS